ncbi:MAG: RAMP superfamily CRISPR-associated protein, partial [Anaerolineae bacterium]
VQEARLDELAGGTEATTWRGLAAFVNGEEKKQYGLAAPADLKDMPEPVQTESVGFYTRRIYDAEKWAQAARRAVEALSA